MITESALLEKVPRGLFIRGEWVEGSRGTFPVHDPATGDVLVEIADASPADAPAADGASTLPAE